MNPILHWRKSIRTDHSSWLYLVKIDSDDSDHYFDNSYCTLVCLKKIYKFEDMHGQKLKI